MGGISKPKLKISKHSSSDLQDVEVIDLADELSPMPYSKLAPRQYRKLHNLHTSVQKNKLEPSVRLPKEKPQFLYASGKELDLSFLGKSQAIGEDDVLGAEESDEEEFPSPSALAAFLKGDSDGPFDTGNVYEEATPSFAEPDDSLEHLETRMRGLPEPAMRQSPTPKVNSSFANGVFDFDAFDKQYGEPEVFSSPLIRQSRKRERSRSPALPETKHRRVEVEEPETSPPIRTSDYQESPATSENPEVESRKVPKKQPVEQSTQPNDQQPPVPTWVNEFDAELIEGLMGIVDFVE